MKYACFEYKNEKKWGVLENGNVRVMESSPFEHSILTIKLFRKLNFRTMSKFKSYFANFKDHFSELNLNLPSLVCFLNPTLNIDQSNQ